MFSKTYRDKPYIIELKRFIEEEYDISITSITPADRGYYGETWRIDCDGFSLFAKLIYYKKHTIHYIDSFPILKFMNDSGLTNVSRIVKCKDNRLYTRFGEGVLGVFKFVEGIHTEDYPLYDLFYNLTLIYKLDPSPIKIKREDFNLDYLDDYLSMTHTLNQIKQDKTANQTLIDDLLQLLQQNSCLTDRYAKRARQFADLCKDDHSDFRITSGDVGGNVIVNGEIFTIIDWDYILLAPIERDTWMYMQDYNQIVLLDKVLEEQGINYKIKNERLAFYCYRTFFYYLCEYINGFLHLDSEKRISLFKDVKAVFTDEYWIYRCTRIADTF